MNEKEWKKKYQKAIDILENDYPNSKYNLNRKDIYIHVQIDDDQLFSSTIRLLTDAGFHFYTYGSYEKGDKVTLTVAIYNEYNDRVHGDK